MIIALCVVFSALVAQLAYLQLVDNSYKISAQNNALRYETRYPVRGRIYDRKGTLLVGNINSYDVMVTPADIRQPFDTAALCGMLALDIEYARERFAYFRKYRSKIGYRSLPFAKGLPFSRYSYFMERSGDFPGFYGVPRTTRQYPYHAGGNLLGYVAEVDQRWLATHPDYASGDFVGRTGIEQVCEQRLRGEKGYAIYLRDSRNVIQSPYENGEHDLPAVAGEDIVTTIDAELQNYGEMLLHNKVGAAIAIEPSTGEILAMVSAPGLDVEVLPNMGRYYDSLSKDPFKPMFNRAVMSPQPPGSVFKLVNGLIGLQEKVVTPSVRYPCSNGYHYGSLTVGCHSHRSPIDLNEAVMMSCNSYFCYLFRSILDNPKYPSVGEAYEKWAEYVKSFGFGVKLGSDFPSEQGGIIPSLKSYEKIYGKGRLRSLNIISLSIGQGEIGSTPLHLANLAATIANRGYYITPHVIRYEQGDSLYEHFHEKHGTMVDSRHFNTVIEGMSMAVNSAPGAGATATVAAIPGIEVCGKTGTAENPHGDEHSVFICFAPRENPKIAVAVYLENAGFGATWAAPVASLMVEKYLKGEISESRKWIETRMCEASLLHKVPASPDYVKPKKK
ncbi:MAG: penicillin-binding protein 2 [Bacteroidales bacterium]|nr:penicillin-binding protein 2 [Bacteroidales bacterium]